MIADTMFQVISDLRFSFPSETFCTSSSGTRPVCKSTLYWNIKELFLTEKKKKVTTAEKVTKQMFTTVCVHLALGSCGIILFNVQ